MAAAPPSLRRDLDGRSIYSRPGVARYATAAQLSLEERLVAHAQAQGAPRVPGELAARRLGADLAQLRAELAGRAHDPREHAAPRGLRLDQAAAAWHALTSARTVEVITGPAAPARPASWPPSPGRGTGRSSAPPPPRTPPTVSAQPGSR